MRLLAVEPSPVEPIAADELEEPEAPDDPEDPEVPGGVEKPDGLDDPEPEEDDDEPDVDDGVEEDDDGEPKRLVAARSALDILFCPPRPPDAPSCELEELLEDAVELFPPDSGATVVVCVVLDGPVLVLPRPPRLPRNRGATRETKF